MHVRNSVKAIIFKGDNILLTKNQDIEGYFYLCPGGGQDHGETFHDTLLRECMEEIGQQVEIGELLFIREYIGKNHEHASLDFNVHQVEYYFSCKIVRTQGNYIQPTNPDNDQVGIEWVPLNDLLKYRLYPKELRGYLIKHFNGEKSPIYLGDIN
jgi:8-oxo-dGTP diphosphatase